MLTVLTTNLALQEVHTLNLDLPGLCLRQSRLKRKIVREKAFYFSGNLAMIQRLKKGHYPF